MKLKNKKIVITVSYGDYTQGVGGTDKVILSQQPLFQSMEITNIHLFPVYKVDKKYLKSCLWGMLINGTFESLFTVEGLVKYLYQTKKRGCSLTAVVIHHFQNINIDDLDYLVSFFNARIFIYLHDYMTICPLGGLVYNKKYFCNNSVMSEANCKDCICYSEDAIRRCEGIKSFLEKYKQRITVVSPSEVALQIWLKSYPAFQENSIVIPHQKFVNKYEGNRRIVLDNEKLKIAFVGYQADLKGWPEWKLATDICKDMNYEFYQFGTAKDHFGYIQEVKVDFKENLSAMTDALRTYSIDCAVIWSTVPETYSFTYHEATAANCFIITNTRSGNVEKQVKKNQNGIVCNYLTETLKKENELRALVNNHKLKSRCAPEKLEENNELILMIAKLDSKFIGKNTFPINKCIYQIYWNLYKECAELYERIKIFLYRYYHRFIGTDK